MQVYHLTSDEKAILAVGFSDRSGHYFTDKFWSGVWVSDVPFYDVMDGDTLLTLNLPDDVFVEYEWVDEGQPRLPYREALIPAAIVNRYGPARLEG
jgi:hypothetical protein